MTRPLTFIPMALALATLVLSSCGDSREARQTGDRSAFRVRVHVVKQTQEAARFVTAGEVVARNRIELASRVSGRVLELLVTEGSPVAAGDLLIRLDAPELESAFAEAQAAETSARLAAETAATQAGRYRRLAASHVVTTRDLELAEMASAAADAALEQARARTRMATRNLGYAQLRAPRAGRVVSRRVRTGDLAVPGRTLLILEDSADLEVRATIPSQMDVGVRAGGAAELTLRGSARSQATRIDRVAPGAQGHTFEVFLDVGGLDAGSGTFVDVAFLGDTTEPTIRVPEEVILRNGPLTGVFVVREDRARLRWLRLAADGRVLTGLAAGDRVVLVPSADLQDGDRVEVAS